MTRHDTIVAGASFATSCPSAFVFSRGRTHRHCRFAGLGAGNPTRAAFRTRQPVRLHVRPERALQVRRLSLSPAGRTTAPRRRSASKNKAGSGWRSSASAAASPIASGTTSRSTPSARRRRGRHAARRTIFFPNDPNLFAAQGPIVKCDEEDGLKRVDTYNTFSLDYITQQGILREGYIDWGISDHVSLRGGRFILPIGFAPREVGADDARRT